MNQQTKQTGTHDLGRFLRELSERQHRIPRKALKKWSHDRNGRSIWRSIWRDQFGKH
jgi:hypothetical protein